MKSTAIYFLFLSILFSSCERNNIDQEDSLIFGEAYGFCVGDCAHFFQIKDNNLLRDNEDRYAGDIPTFEAKPLSGPDYELANALLTNFPQYLVDHPNQTLGCPDCADQGGIHLYYTKGNQQFFWHIDTFVDNQPVEIRDYINQVKDVIADLKN
jgi:hypothetical protein